MSEKNITKKDVEYVAKLARIDISAQETEKYQGELESILGHIAQLKEVETKNVKSTAHPHAVSNVWREDLVNPFDKIKEVLANAPDREETFYKVKKVIE